MEVTILAHDPVHAPSPPRGTGRGDVSRDALGAADVVSVMERFAHLLGRHREALNRLNVYPVPDGDTGTNMFLTLESVGRELATVTEVADMRSTCKAISHGSLMGARGNSGVILCQILRGLADTFAADGEGAGTAVGPVQLAAALVEANLTARASVMKPVEGTILTVAAAAAEAAAHALDDAGGAALVNVADAARRAAVEALWDTPNQLPVLASAGVVDAGGAGLLLLYDAFLEVIDGREAPAQLPLPAAVAALLANSADWGKDHGHAVEPTPAGEGEPFGPDDLRYEVMYLLEAPDHSIAGFKAVWAGIGDSIVVVGGDGMWNCHIHTSDIGAAMEAAMDAGRPRNIRVTDLTDQVEEESWVRRAAGTAAPVEDLGPPPVTSVVAVATGDGIGRIFLSLGVRDIVAGGQSMNPSTEQILEVMDATRGAEVILLPNNKNIVAVALQACELSTKPARVVETAGIQEGFAALLEYDPEAGADANAAAMTAAASRVTAGEVTRAVRAGETEMGEIAAGDWIGLSRRGIEVVAGNAADAATRLLDRLLTEGSEIVTIIEGLGAKPADTRRVTEWLTEQRPGLAVELHHGGQPLYPYLVAVE